MENNLVERVVDLAIDIQQIPAPTFYEGRRAAFVRRGFLNVGLSDVFKDKTGNVFARLPGSGKLPPIVVTAHLDTVFPLTTELTVDRMGGRICGPGMGDNSIGVAGLFGLIWSLMGGEEFNNKSFDHQSDLLIKDEGGTITSDLPGDIWLVANVCEEGLGDLRGMKAVVDRFDDRVLAYIVLEGMALGQVYHRALGVRRYRISIKTPGGHSWVDSENPSAVEELSKLIVKLYELPLLKHPRTTLNVGVVAGGTSVNTIADHAELELDLRSEDGFPLNQLVGQVKNLVIESHKPNVEVGIELIGQRPTGEIEEDHPLVELAAKKMWDVGYKAKLAIGSTDANVPLSRGIPAICLGITSGSGAHTRKEYINLDPVERGLRCLTAIVQAAFEVLGGPD